MDMKNICVKAVSLLLLSVAVGTLLLIMAFCIPTARIKTNASKAVPMFTQETNYFSTMPDIGQGQLDNYTDALYLNAATINNTDAGLFTSMLGYTHTVDEVEGGPAEQFVAYFDSAKDSQLSQYGYHFWNGYEIIVKILLLFTTYSGIRYINLCLEWLLLFLLLKLMNRRGLSNYQLPVLLGFLFLNPFAMTMCMAFAGYYYCTVIPCILMCLFNEWLKEGFRYVFFFEVIGILVIYFDMNYIQLISFGIPVLFYFLLNGFPESTKKLVFHLGKYFCFWFFGYAGMMVGKWCVLDLCSDMDVWRDMINHIIFRLSTNVGDENMSRLYAIGTNGYYALRNPIFDIIEAVYICVCLYLFFKSKKANALKNYSIEIMSVVFMLLLVLARYAIFANHVIIHAWVVYRLLVIPMFAFNIVLAKMVADTKTN